MHVIYHTYLLSAIFTVAMSIIKSVLVLSAYHIHSDYLTFLPGIVFCICLEHIIQLPGFVSGFFVYQRNLFCIHVCI